MTAPRSWSAFAVCLCLLSAVPLRAQDAPSPAIGEDLDLARQHFKAGVDYYRDGDLPAALVEFKRAYAAVPNYRILYNLGQVSQELREYPDASRYYDQYLSEGGDAIDETRRREVSLALAKVRARIAELQLSSNVSDVEYFIDDVSVGRSPFDRPLFVSAGRHRIAAVTPTGERSTEQVDVAGGESMELHLNFAKNDTVPAPNAAAARLDSRGAPPRRLGPALWLGIGTGALALGAGVFAVLAAEDGSDYRAALERKTSAGELDDLHDSATAKALVTDILLGASLVGGAFTLYFLLRDPPAERNWRPRAQLELGPGRLRLRGTF